MTNNIQKGFAVYLDTKKADKYLDYIKRIPGVELVIHCDDWRKSQYTRYLVKTRTPQRLSFFKKVPYVKITEFYNAKYIRDENNLDDDSTEESSEDSSELVKKTYSYYRDDLKAKMMKMHYYQERLAEARLRRELEDIHIQNLIGFATNTPDERPLIPEPRHWPSKQWVKDQDKQYVDDDIDPLLKKIRDDHGMYSNVEDDYFYHDTFFTKYPMYRKYQ